MIVNSVHHIYTYKQCKQIEKHHIIRIMIKICKPTLPPYTMWPLRASYSVTLSCKQASVIGHGQWIFVHGYRHWPNVNKHSRYRSRTMVTVIQTHNYFQFILFLFVLFTAMQFSQTDTLARTCTLNQRKIHVHT